MYFPSQVYYTAKNNRIVTFNIINMKLINQVFWKHMSPDRHNGGSVMQSYS